MSHLRENLTKHEKPSNELLESTYEEVRDRTEMLFNDPDIRLLIYNRAQERGLDIPDIRDVGSYIDEDELLAIAQKTLDMRSGGKERDEMASIQFEGVTKDALDKIISRYNMAIDTEPNRKDFDIAIIPGSPGRSPCDRLGYLKHLIESGRMDTNLFVFLGSERPVSDKRQNGRMSEIERAGKAGYNRAGESAKTEFELLMNTAAVEFDIADEDWEITEGQDHLIPEQHRYQSKYRIAYANKNGRDVIVLSAPMLGESRLYPDGNRRTRTNTSDTLMMAADMARDHVAEGEEVHSVMVTEAMFANFQDADAKSIFAKHGLHHQTARFYDQPALAEEWGDSDALYAQEILSMLQRTKAARDALK